MFANHAPGRLVHGVNYLGLHHTDRFIVIQITMNAGRTLDQKKGLFADIAGGIAERTKARSEDVLITLVEVPKENWSFGNGEAQYAGTG